MSVKSAKLYDLNVHILLITLEYTTTSPHPDIMWRKWQYHFSYNCFRTVLFVRCFSYNYFSYELFVQIQGGGGKSSRVRGGISSHKLLLRRRFFAPLASNFAPPLLYLYEKSVRKLIARKVPVRKVRTKNNCTKSTVRKALVRKVCTKSP